MVGGSAAAGAGPGSGGDGLVTHWPFLKSCQGKHPLSVEMLRFDCEWAGSKMENVEQIRIAIVAEKRVMQKNPVAISNRAQHNHTL
jgi:hypothetical protein